MSGHKPTLTDVEETVEILGDHIHTPQGVYPTLADGVELTSHATDWVLGTITQIIPASTIRSIFDVHGILVESLDTKDKAYEVVLYYGSTDIECARARFQSDTNKGGVPAIKVMTVRIPADSRVRAALAVQDGGGKKCIISLRYHVY